MEDIKTNKILVNVVLDRSGSMDSNRDGTIAGYNEYIHGLRQDKESEYSVSLIQFDAPISTPELTVSYMDQALADVPVLTREGYAPRGSTPLYDAIGECIRRVEQKGRGVICLIITDGHENASQEFTKDQIQQLIKSKEAEGWTFAFLGANIDSYAVGGSMGIAATATANYMAGNEQALYSNLAQATVTRGTQYRTMGMQSAVKMCMFDDGQRAAMTAQPTYTTITPPLTGGRPAAPPSFRPDPPKPKPRRNWNTKQPA